MGLERCSCCMCVDVWIQECFHVPLVKAGAASRQKEGCQNTVIAVMTERGIKSHQIYFPGPPKGEN